MRSRRQVLVARRCVTTGSAAPRDLRSIALVAVVVGVVAWGAGPLFVRGMSVSSPTVLFYRALLAQPLAIGAAYLFGGRITWVLVRRSIIPGACFAMTQILAFASFRATSIANASLIPSLLPVLILLVAHRLFGERIVRRDILLATLALAGMIVVVGFAAGDSGAALEGDLLAVGNLLFSVGFFVLTKRARMDNVHSWSFLAAMYMVTAVMITPWAVLSSGDLGAVTGKDWLLLSLLVIGPGMIGHGLITWAHQHVEASVTSVMTLGFPVVAAIGAWIVYSQELGPVQIGGAILVLVARGGRGRNQRADRALAAEVAIAGEILDV